MNGYFISDTIHFNSEILYLIYHIVYDILYNIVNIIIV